MSITHLYLLSLAVDGALRCILQSSKPFPVIALRHTLFLLLTSSNLERFLLLNMSECAEYRKAVARSYMVCSRFVVHNIVHPLYSYID